MDWLAYEEMEYHWNCQFDYQAELAREHYDPCWDMEDEDEVYVKVQVDDWRPQQDSHVKDWYLHTDNIPF